MPKRKVVCPDCGMKLEPLFIQTMQDNGKRTFRTIDISYCWNDKRYIKRDELVQSDGSKSTFNVVS